MDKLLCIENLEIDRKSSGKHTFKKNEHYEGDKINNDWWCIDSIGVEAIIFDKHFVKEEDYIQCDSEMEVKLTQ